MQSVDLAVVGATGAVGEAVVELLEKRKFPVNHLYLLASERTAGTSLMFNSTPIMVTELKGFDFSKVQLAIFVANDDVSSEYLPIAQAKGCLTIDNSQAFAESAPLVVPQVNSDILAAKPEVIVNPDGNAIQLSTVLKPLIDHFGVERVNATALQSVSIHGKKAINELATQTASLLNGRGAESSIFSQQIAFNVLPSVGEIMPDGHSVIEKRWVEQTKRLLNDSGLALSVASIQVPVFYSDAMTVTVALREHVQVEEVRSLLGAIDQVTMADGLSQDVFATPVTNATGTDSIFVSRVRRDTGDSNSFSFWLTADNVRKNAANNSIRIAEEFIKHQ